MLPKTLSVVVDAAPVLASIGMLAARVVVVSGLSSTSSLGPFHVRIDHGDASRPDRLRRDRVGIVSGEEKEYYFWVGDIERLAFFFSRSRPPRRLPPVTACSGQMRQRRCKWSCWVSPSVVEWQVASSEDRETGAKEEKENNILEI